MRTGSMPASVVADHILWLKRTIGPSNMQIAEAAGVDERSIRYILHAPPERGVYPKTAKRLLALDARSFPALQSNGYVPSFPTARRVHALMTIGWSRNTVAERAGLAKRTLMPSQIEGIMSVRHSTSARVERVYSGLRQHPNFAASGERSRLRARELGYAPPWAWPGTSIDKWLAKPDLELIEDRAWKKAVVERYFKRDDAELSASG